MTREARLIYERAIAAYGERAQLFKVLEELSELIHAVARYAALPDDPLSDAGARVMDQSLDHIAEEIADVRIMLDQLEMITDTHTHAARWKWRKLTRLSERLNGGK